MLDSLDKAENGFQILYRCLRETQYSCPKHKLAADILKNAGMYTLWMFYKFIVYCIDAEAGHVSELLHSAHTV